MKLKHPGIIFTLACIPVLFVLGYVSFTIHWNDYIENSIVFFIGASMFWWMVYFHVKWIESQFRKQK